MALNILCTGDHEHAPWSIQDGVFDTAREAEYTPQLAKALATTVLESIAGKFDLPNVAQFSKRLKVSHFHSIAAGKQPFKLTSLPAVPEISHIVALSNLPAGFDLALADGCLQTCTLVQVTIGKYLVLCGSKLLRKTDRKGGENRLFGYSVDSTPSLHVLGDVESVGVIGEEVPLMCNRSECPCNGLQLGLDKPETMDDCSDWVFWGALVPGDFSEEGGAGGASF